MPPRPPVRIVFGPRHQPGTDRIQNRVMGKILEILVPAHGVIVKSGLPERSIKAEHPVELRRVPRNSAVDHHKLW